MTTSRSAGCLSLLLEFDFEVVGVAADGTEAVDAVVDSDPDVVIIDYMMPGVDGIETARAIRRLRPDQSVILYTACLDGDIEEQARQAGIVDCVTKLDGPVALERAITASAGNCSESPALGHGGVPG